MNIRAVRERFEEKYLPEPNSGCWLWTASLDSWGYGQLRVAGKNRLAHKLAYEFYKGPIVGGLQVNHTCDVASCVNPGHLYLGTQRDNCDDMVRRGRQRGAVGSRNSNAKIDEKMALEIIRRKGGGVSAKVVASEYAIGRSQVASIWAGTAWKALVR